MAQKEVCDEILFSETLPCTGKDISDAGLEGFGNTSTSVDDANWMPIAPFPSSMPALSLPPNESYDAKMCISVMPNAEAFWGQNWLEEHQRSLKDAFLGIPTQNM